MLYGLTARCGSKHDVALPRSYLARRCNLEEVGIDARGGHRRARAGALHHERLRRVPCRVERNDVVGVPSEQQ